ncbi:MAG: class I SAM-dependent methyltransferase [bacterium]
MGIYRRYLFPRIVEFACGQESVSALRRELLAPVRGEVLEIGFGTGLNLPHYPKGVRRLAVFDPNPGMLAMAQARIKRSFLPLEIHPFTGNSLAFADRSFDAVVSTFTLCSVADLAATLAELRRVLRPEGRLYFLEHGLSRDPKVQAWQHRLTPVQKFLFDGCHLDRDIPKGLADAGFRIRELRQAYLPKEPKILAYYSLGSASP